MTTITLKFNEKSILGKTLMALINVGTKEKKEIEVLKTPNTETIKAMVEARAGIGITKTKNHKDLMKKLNA